MKSRDEGEPYQLKNKQHRRVSLLCLCHYDSRLTVEPKSTSFKGWATSTFLLTALSLSLNPPHVCIGDNQLLMSE